MNKRARSALTLYGRTIRSLPTPVSAIGLFCDCEGHFAGERGERHFKGGLLRLLEVLDDAGVKITFNVVADLCRTHLRQVEQIKAARHEIGCHGWRHERPRQQSVAQLDEVLWQAREAFGNLGITPTGFRSPESAWSIALVKKLAQTSYQWNAERDVSANPYRIWNRLVRLRVLTDDWDLADGTGTPESLLDKWRGKLEQSISQGGLACFGVHEWLFGLHSDFAPALKHFLAELRDRQIRIYTLGELAATSCQ